MLLARTWFHCSAAELLRRVTPREIIEMQAMFDLSPWGEYRADIAAAVVAQTSIVPHLKEGAKAPALEAIMPFLEHKERLPTEEELAAKLGMLTGVQ